MGQSQSQSRQPQESQQHTSTEQQDEAHASSQPATTTSNTYPEHRERPRTTSRHSVVSGTSLDRLRSHKGPRASYPATSSQEKTGPSSKFRQRLSRTFTPRSKSKARKELSEGPVERHELNEGVDAPLEPVNSPGVNHEETTEPQEEALSRPRTMEGHPEEEAEDHEQNVPAGDCIATAVPASAASASAGPPSQRSLPSSPSNLAPSPPLAPPQDSRRPSSSQLSVPPSAASDDRDSWRTAQNHSPRSERSSVSSTPARRIMVQGTIAASPSPSSPHQPPQPEQPPAQPEAEQPRRSEESIFNPAAQAVLVSRLLSSASAATAASLLPGRINVGGRDIEPFPGLAQQQQQQPREEFQERPARPRLNSDELALGRTEHSQQRARSNSAPDAISTERASRPNQEPEQAHESERPSEQGGGLHMTRPSLSDAPMPSLQAPQGSFERFLADLQTDLSFAILRDHFSPSQPSNEEFSFFRSFRFEERGLDHDGQLREPEGGARDLGRTGQREELDLTAPADLEALAARPPPEESDGAEREQQGPRQEMVSPLLLVGVRSVPIQPQPQPQQQQAQASREPQQSTEERLASAHPFAFLGPQQHQQQQQSSSSEGARSPLQDGPRRDSSGANADLEPEPTPQVQTDEDEEAERGPTPANTEEHEPLLTPPEPAEEAPEADEDLPQPTPRPQRRRSPRAYVIWIAGGIYPASHPLLLFSDLDNARYEDLVRLAEVIGSVKRTTATQDEIDQAELPVVSVHDLPALQESGDVLENTVERCLICLEGYEDAAEAPLRLLKCRHAFHKECVDKWLLSSKNSCPCCRVTAVAQKDDTPKSEDAPPDDSGAERPQQQFRREDPLDQIANALHRESLA